MACARHARREEEEENRQQQDEAQRRDAQLRAVQAYFLRLPPQLRLFDVETADVEQRGEFAEGPFVVVADLFAVEVEVVFLTFVGGFVVAGFGIGFRTGLEQFVEIGFAVPGLFEQTDQFVERGQRLAEFMFGEIDGKLRFGEAGRRKVSAVSLPDPVEQRAGFGAPAGPAVENHLLELQRPDVFGQGEPRLAFFELFGGFFVPSGVDEDGGQLGIENRQREFAEVVLFDEADRLAVVVGGALLETAGPVDVAQLLVGFGDGGFVVVLLGLRHVTLQFVLRQRVLPVLRVVENQPRPSEKIVGRLVVGAREGLHAGNPRLEGVRFVVEVIVVGLEREGDGLHADVVFFARQPEQRVGLEQDDRIADVVVAPAVIGVKRAVYVFVGFGLRVAGRNPDKQHQ